MDATVGNEYSHELNNTKSRVEPPSRAALFLLTKSVQFELLALANYMELQFWNLTTKLFGKLSRFGNRAGLISFALIALCTTIGNAQYQPKEHHFSGTDLAPGTIAFQSLLTNPQWTGKVQPVKLLLPDGATAGTWQGNWVDADYANPTVAMSIGPLYRFRGTGFPRQPNIEIFPTVELISCMNPPADMELRFPIPVAISDEDIAQVAKGRMVTKVVYLENPETALPYRQRVNDQPFFDVSDVEDPLRVAERLGRPVAIVRIGTRLPSAEELNLQNSNAIPMTVFPELAAKELDSRVETVAFHTVNTQDPSIGSVVLPSTSGSRLKLPVRQATFRFSRPEVMRLPSAAKTSGLPADGLVVAERSTTQDPVYANATGPVVNPCDNCPTLQFAEPYRRDEFLLDGGDRRNAVIVREDWKVLGLDSEDTIAHYDTQDGRRLVSPSNRVAIYSPRFAAVRRVSQPSSESSPMRVAKMNDKIQLEAARGKDFSSTTLQRMQVGRNVGATRANGLEDKTRGIAADNVTHLFGAREYFQPYENFRIMKYGEHSGAESARLDLGMTAARVWEDNLGLQIAANKTQPIIVRESARVQEIVTVKLENGESKLQVVKVASKIAAQPGEEIEFTIRFDNVGDQAIGNVTIIDSLTTRLEYVSDSAECTLHADFSSERNEGDSLVLRWEIRDSLAVGKGGLIRFRCRVR